MALPQNRDMTCAMRPYYRTLPDHPRNQSAKTPRSHPAPCKPRPQTWRQVKEAMFRMINPCKLKQRCQTTFGDHSDAGEDQTTYNPFTGIPSYGSQPMTHSHLMHSRDQYQFHFHSSLFWQKCLFLLRGDCYIKFSLNHPQAVSFR